MTNAQSSPNDPPPMRSTSEGASADVKTLNNDETYSMGGTSSAPILSKEHKALHLTEATQQILLKSEMESPPNKLTTRLNSSLNQTHSSINPTGLEKIPQSNETGSQGTSSEATEQIPMEIDALLPPKEITTKPNSTHNHKHNTTIQIAFEKSSMNNETGKEGMSSEATQQMPLKIDTPSPPNDTTMGPNFSQDQTDSTTKHIILERSPRNDDTGSEGMSSEATQQIPVKIDTQSPPTDIITMRNYSLNQTNYPKQIALEETARNKDTDREGTSSAAKLLQELKAFHHRKTIQQVTRNNDEQSQPNVVPPRFNSSKEALGSSRFLFGKKSGSASSPLQQNQTHSTENQTKTPSNVRKMISALESSQPQGPVPRASASKLKPLLSKFRPEFFPEESSSTEAKMENAETTKQIIERELNRYSLKKLLEVNVQQNVDMENTETKEHIIDREMDPHLVREPFEVSTQNNEKYVGSEKQVDFDAQTASASDKLPISQSTKQLEALDTWLEPVERSNSDEQVESNIQHNMEDVDTQERLLEEVSIISKAEKATISGVIDHPVSKEHAYRSLISPSNGQLELSDARPDAVEGSNSSELVDCNIQHKKKNMKRRETLLENFVVTSEGKAAISGRVIDDSLHNHPVHHEQQGSTLNASEDSGLTTCGDNSDKINTCDWKSLEYLEVEQSHGEVMETWILPDERRRLCITTASKHAIDIMGYFDTCGVSNQRETSLCRMGVDEEVASSDSNTLVKVDEIETTSRNTGKQKHERLNGDSGSGGLIGQGVKIAIMVAFGTLVIVTRQVKNR